LRFHNCLHGSAQREKYGTLIEIAAIKTRVILQSHPGKLLAYITDQSGAEPRSVVMKVSPKPLNERERLEEILRYRILDSQAEQEYDDIVELAAQVCQVPIAVVTLLDSCRQWFKAKKGLDVAETPIEVSFCAHAIHEDHIMVIEDAEKDERFFDNPFVTGPPHIRFYAGVALTSPRGYRLGALAVIDQKPRILTAEQIKSLHILAKQLINLLNVRVDNWNLNQDIIQKSNEVQDILGRISEAFVAVDQNWSVSFINEKAAAITKRRPNEVMGKNLWLEFPEAFDSDFPEIAKAAMINHQSQYLERFFAPYQRWFETHIYPSPTGLSIYFRDITERKNSEEAIREAEAKYRSIFENASEGMYQTTPSGQFITANPALAKMLGYSSPSDLLTSVTDIANQLYANGEDRNEIKRRLARLGKVDNFELQLTKQNGEQIWVRANIRSVTSTKNGRRYFEGALEDITERKSNAEKLNAQFQELKKTNEELDRFVYSASHDLRAPLATILGLLNIADLETNQPSVKGYHQMIRGSVNRLDGFIRDILDYSLNTRKGVQYEKIDFHMMISEILNNHNFLSTLDRLKIKREITTTYPFYSDRYRVTIVLNNLLSNAIKYQDYEKKDSHLTIRIETLEDRCMITFEDNGIGIHESHLDKIFNMFYRASEAAKGSGLGLYITKETVHKLGGTLTVSSIHGESTTFQLELPNKQMALSG
jgi:PAS domain S-box-containing protein